MFVGGVEEAKQPLGGKVDNFSQNMKKIKLNLDKTKQTPSQKLSQDKMYIFSRPYI